MRAIYPTQSGHAVNPKDGVRIAYEVFEPEGWTRTIVFVPTWIVIHSRRLKLQVPYFFHHGFRVVTYDGRGNGQSDRPETGYAHEDHVQDTLAVFDELDIDSAYIVGNSAAGHWGTRFAVDYPDRVSGLVLIGPSAGLDAPPAGALERFLAEPSDDGEPNRFSAHFWRRDYAGFLEWFFTGVFTEPHSTKAIEDCVGWGLETTPEILISTMVEGGLEGIRPRLSRVQCPFLIIHGTEDAIIPIDHARAIHEAAPGSQLVEIAGGGHAPNVRDPVLVNSLMHDFIGREAPPRKSWTRAASRQTMRALFVSSPIGLGHVQRDLAIASELRELVPGLEIDWLAQPPVTQVLEQSAERIHPLSGRLALESPHIQSEATGVHELNVFQAWRNMDEILYSNFVVFQQAAQAGHYDLWIGDEAWEVDYYLHENPEFKSAPFAWLTDFVGWAPMTTNDGGREAFLTADYNAEMIAQVERYPRVRDVSLFIGEPDDIVPQRFGDGMPRIREWTEDHFEFVGYTDYLDPTTVCDRNELRGRFGFAANECVAIAAVGGSGLGAGLLNLLLNSYDIMRESLPDLKLVVVGGPRIDPDSLPRHKNIEYHGYVHNLHEMLAACDVALVQGGLSTTMELVAARRPFLYFPLLKHCEQNVHVAHRLDRYGVAPTNRIAFDQATPDGIAAALTDIVSQPVNYLPVERGGARRAAERLAALL